MLCAFKSGLKALVCELCSGASRHSVKVADKWERVHRINCKLQESSRLPKNNKCQGLGALLAPWSLDLECPHSSKRVPLRAWCSSGKRQGWDLAGLGVVFTLCSKVCVMERKVRGLQDTLKRKQFLSHPFPYLLDSVNPNLQVAAFWAEQGLPGAGSLGR